MKKFRELKDYVKEHIPQVIATVAGITAVLQQEETEGMEKYE